VHGRIRDVRRQLFRLLVGWLIVVASHAASINYSRIGSRFNATRNISSRQTQQRAGPDAAYARPVQNRTLSLVRIAS